MIDSKIIVSCAIGVIVALAVYEMLGVTQMLNKTATTFGAPK